jgi:hypothetical protein
MSLGEYLTLQKVQNVNVMLACTRKLGKLTRTILLLYAYQSRISYVKYYRLDLVQVQNNNPFLAPG